MSAIRGKSQPSHKGGGGGGLFYDRDAPRFAVVFSREKIRDPMTATKCPATYCRTPLRGILRPRRFAPRKIVLDMGITILYS